VLADSGAEVAARGGSLLFDAEISR
jgi:hypothetical protein